jgi:hypothetical protein
VGLLPRGALAADPAQRCQAAKLKQAGKYAACRLQAARKAALREQSPDLSACDLKLANAWERAEGGGDCETAGDLAAIQDELSTSAQTVIGALKPGVLFATCGGSYPQCGGFCPAGEVCVRERTCGSGFGTCTEDADCEPFGCLPTGCTCVSTAGAKRAFVTSELHTGDLDGLVGADQICQRLAGSAGLSGTFKAWLSVEDSGPDTRFTHADVPYLRTDDVVVADHWGDLTDGDLRNPLIVDQNAAVVTHCTTPSYDDFCPDAAAWVWTRTDSKGAPASIGDDCQDWTVGTSGLGGVFGSLWDAYEPDAVYAPPSYYWTNTGGQTFCQYDMRLYCFQQ